MVKGERRYFGAETEVTHVQRYAINTIRYGSKVCGTKFSIEQRLTTNRKSDRLTEREQVSRSHAVSHLLQDSIRLAEEQISRQKVLDQKMELQAQTSTVILSTVRSGLTSLTQVRTIVIDMKNMLDLFHNLILSQQSIPQGIGGQWKQAPITLELATGKQIPLPLELVTSWEVLDVILSGLFKSHPAAQEKIRRREFAIEEGDSGREVSRTWDLDMSFHAGQKVDMSMIFSDLDAKRNTCPGCKTEYKTSLETRTQCTKCKTWFQRVIEDMDGPEIEFAGFPSGQLPTIKSSMPRKKSLSTLGPGDFKRVRLTRKRSVVSTGSSITVVEDGVTLSVTKKPIRFHDAVGRKFSFPFDLCSTWSVSWHDNTIQPRITNHMQREWRS